MHIFKSSAAGRVEPPGHFGNLQVADVVPREQGQNFVTQLSYCPPGGGGEKHHHDDDAQVFLVVSGQLTFDTGTERFTLHEHEAVLFQPGEPHATQNESDNESVSVVVTVRR